MQRMTMPTIPSALSVLLFAGLLGFAPVLAPGLAQAQSNPEQLADANRVAMDAYNSLDIETARVALERALEAAHENNVTGPALARTYSNLGVVYCGGLNDNDTALDAFVKALQQDPSVEPDPLVSTPEIQRVFELAKRKVSDGRSAGATLTPVPTGEGVQNKGDVTPGPDAAPLTQTGAAVRVKASAEPRLEGDACVSGCKGKGGERAGDASRFFLDLHIGLGAAYVGRNGKADSSVPEMTVAGSSSADEARAAALRAGWDCSVRHVTADGLPTLQRDECNVAVDKPGIVPNFAVHAVAGYFVIPRLYVALMGRMQLASGEGVLAGLLFGARAGYLLTQPVETGLFASLFVGASVGQVQVQPHVKSGTERGPYVVSGLGGVQLGTSIGYRFTRHLGFNVTPQAHLLMPRLLFNVDVSAGPNITF